MLLKWLTFWVFPAPKRDCFRKFLKNGKLVQLMLLKRLNFWVFIQPLKRSDFGKFLKNEKNMPRNMLILIFHDEYYTYPTKYF